MMTKLYPGMRAMTIALCLLLTVCAGSSNPALAQTRYTPTNIHDGGSITGTVSLGTGAFNPDLMEVAQDNKTCGKAKQSPRLLMGKNRGIADAIIYLEGVSAGKQFAAPKEFLLTQQNCEYSPHALIVPVGTKLNIVNNDAILHNAHCYDCEKDLKTIFNIAQPVKGLKTCTRSLDNPGLLALSCDAGHPWMSAYVMVAQHPYYVITDRNGYFSLDNVPPGSYTLHLWHEGVAITKKEVEHDKVKKYEYEEPYEMTQKVTVSAKSSTTANFTMVLR